MARQFILVRVLNMRGVNLNAFDFDYDLTWAAFFMNANEKVYGRFGGRGPDSPDTYLTLAGLKHAMRHGLEAHRREPAAKPPYEVRPIRTVEQYAAAARLKPDACVHCHQVYDFRREQLQLEDKWLLDKVWVYPLPDNLGIRVDPDQPDLVRSIQAGSSAERVGLRTGDVVASVNGQPVASFADFAYALHRVADITSIPIAWRREGRTMSARLDLPSDWRKTDLSWRTSMFGLDPSPRVEGPDLTPQEKQSLGLSAKALAFRQNSYVQLPARAAGIRAGDIILGIDNKQLEMTMVQFHAYIRINCRVGEEITFNILRDGKRLDLPMQLTARAR